MSYGILNMIVSLLFATVSNFVIKKKYTDQKDMRRIMQKAYGKHSNFYGGISVAVIVLAYFQPNWALIFYLAVPVLAFFTTSSDHSEVENVTEMSSTQQKDYFNLSSSELRDFRKKQSEIRSEYSKQRNSNPDWREDMRKAISELLREQLEKKGADPEVAGNVQRFAATIMNRSGSHKNNKHNQQHYLNQQQRRARQEQQHKNNNRHDD